MKTVLVLAEHPELAQVVPQALSADQYRVLHRTTIEDAEPLLGGGLVDACIIDVEAGAVQGIWAIEKLRRRMPNVPVVVYVGAKPWDWEEEAYVHGVSFVVSKPVRPRMLNILLERLWKTAAPGMALAIAPRPPATVVRTQVIEPARGQSAPSPVQTLSALRDFSAILTHSLSAEGLLKQFLLLLREIIGVNRAAIFLRSPVAGAGDAPQAQSRRLSSACAIGLSSGLLEHFQLSLESGMGAHLFRNGRILRRYSDEAAGDAEVEKEFESLGAQVAVPILDRETLVGVAVFDGRVTGELLSNSELELIFHLLEELGLAVKNIWLHDQLAENHGMLTNILRELSSACVLVSRDLAILHANKTARSYFGRAAAKRSGELEFSDLPMVLGSKVYQVLKTGTAIATFRYQPPDQGNAVYQVTIMPFQAQAGGLPNSVLLVVEDLTQSEHLKRLEIEAANLRLVRTMADRLAHEVGNALVPLSTHQQLLMDKYRDPEFRASLDHALADGVKRISRLINQMRFLAREGVMQRESLPLHDLIHEAFQDAQKHQSAKTSKLKEEAADQPIVLAGDHAALRHAFSEVFLNALQANPADPRIAVRSLTDTDVAGSRWVHIDVEDNGAGFTAEALKKVPEPFYTTRNVGLGLGLTVSRKIIETHQGKLAILPPQEGHSSVVRISLPLVPTPRA